MLRPKYIVTFICLTTLMWVYPAKATAEGLVFSIKSIKNSYLVAEPVFIDFSLENKSSSEAITVSPEIEVEKEMVSLFIASGKKGFIQYHPGYVGEPSLLPRTLNLSEKVTHRQLVLYNGSMKDYAFPKAGVYRVRAVYHRFGSAPDVESNTIEIQVAEPAANEAETAKLFKSKDIADLIMNIGESNKAVVNLERLMNRYPSTIYGKYAQFYLARRQSREFFERKPNNKRAINLYRDLIQKDPAFPLIAEANYHLGLALIKTQNYSEASERINFTIKKSPETRLIEGAKRILKRIKKQEKPKEMK